MKREQNLIYFEVLRQVLYLIEIFQPHDVESTAKNVSFFVLFFSFSNHFFSPKMIIYHCLEMENSLIYELHFYSNGEMLFTEVTVKAWVGSLYNSLP